MRASTRYKNNIPPRHIPTVRQVGLASVAIDKACRTPSRGAPPKRSLKQFKLTILAFPSMLEFMSSIQPAENSVASTDTAVAEMPLFVDLDGTLIASDVTYESVLGGIKRKPGLLPRLPWLLVRGRAALKREMAQEVGADVRLLPYRQEVLHFLREQRWAGRRVILATASDRRFADAVAKEVGLFDDVLASDGQINLKGPNKLAAIQAYCREHGYAQFAYAGDALADLPIWKEAAEVHVVAPGPLVRAATRSLDKPIHVHARRQGLAAAAVRAMRPQQWIKNLLLFVPLLLSHQWDNLAKVIACCIGFIAFSACASAVYLLNDLLDVEADRHHPTKRHRPFAAGAFPIHYGLPLSAGLLAFSVSLSLAALPTAFVGYLGLYLLVNCMYSFWLKQKLVLDVLLLAGMYALRIVVGGVATDIWPVSEWLAAFSIFLFTSLAFAKRHSELARLAEEEVEAPRGRGYVVGDLSMIESVGPTSGYLAVLVLALYINSEEMKLLYAQPGALWLICPLMLYWITRLWFAVKRGELNEDPLVYAVRDRVSILVGLCVVALAIIATKF
jgi:4-hydroxybenzoate polyprenyltransferase/phosphoglycolate phosphatase-like HAD superfamily hydrolase